MVTMLWVSVAMLIPITNKQEIGNFYSAHFALVAFIILAISILIYSANKKSGNTLLLFYAITYTFFHFGIVPVYLISPEDLGGLGFGLIWWYHKIELVMAAYFSAVVFLAGLATSLVLPIKFKDASRFDAKRNLKLGKFALIGLVFGILIWGAIVSSVGVGAYDRLLEMLAEDSLTGAIGIVHTLIGITFIVAVMEPSTRHKAIFFYGFWSLLAFPSGLRGEVAFPAVIALGLAASQGLVRVTLKRALIGSGFFLAASSAVAQTRISTSGASFLDSISISKGIAELGGSIRASYEVMLWIAKGDTFMLGETYYAPFERLFLRFIPLRERLPASEDYRLMNVLIGERAGPYGFSISAEAFYNFSYMGVALGGVLTGFALRHLGQRSIARNFPMLQLSLGFALFIHIRQDFVTAWSGMLYSILILTSLLFFTRIKTNG